MLSFADPIGFLNIYRLNCIFLGDAADKERHHQSTVMESVAKKLNVHNWCVYHGIHSGIA